MKRRVGYFVRKARRPCQSKIFLKRLDLSMHFETAIRRPLVNRGDGLFFIFCRRDKLIHGREIRRNQSRRVCPHVAGFFQLRRVASRPP